MLFLLQIVEVLIVIEELTSSCGIPLPLYSRVHNNSWRYLEPAIDKTFVFILQQQQKQQCLDTEGAAGGGGIGVVNGNCRKSDIIIHKYQE